MLPACFQRFNEFFWQETTTSNYRPVICSSRCWADPDTYMYLDKLECPWFFRFWGRSIWASLNTPFFQSDCDSRTEHSAGGVTYIVDCLGVSSRVSQVVANHDYLLTHWRYTLGDSGDFKTSRYQGIVKATVFYRLDDLKFKISEGSDQNWSCPESAQLAVSV